MSIIGVGTDIVKVERIAGLLKEYGETFAHKILDESEFLDFSQDDDKIGFLAKRFAAKEACAKAFGTGFSDGIVMKDIVISNDKKGKPIITLKGKALDKAKELESNKLSLSISDEKEFAVAFVILTKM